MFKAFSFAFTTVITSTFVFSEPMIQTETNWLDVSLTQTLIVPELTLGQPKAGKRVKVVTEEFVGTKVYHTLYLPKHWHEGIHCIPIVFEYTGNKWAPGNSTGRVEDAKLGFGYSQGRFIWVSLPYVEKNKFENALVWWGDIEATAQYALINVPDIIQSYGADPNAVFLVGFSRGAIGVNFIGLRSDNISKLWSAFVIHDHFDGLREWENTTWGTPYQDYRKTARNRLQRVDGRPYMITSKSLDSTRKFIEDSLNDSNNFYYAETNMRKVDNPLAISEHNDTWMLVDNPFRKRVWRWINNVVESSNCDK